jgi:hypothetical protein
MTILKWIFVTVGVLFAACVAIVVGLGFWASSVEAVQISEADFQPGGTYTQAERDDLLKACEQSKNTKLPNCCNCIADNGAKLSRYSRLMLGVGLGGMDTTRMVAITKGLMESGVSEEKIEAAGKDLEQQAEEIKKSCGLLP